MVFDGTFHKTYRRGLLGNFFIARNGMIPPYQVVSY